MADEINTDKEIKASQLFLDVFDESRAFQTEKGQLTLDGFLKGRAIVTNTGIFNYMGSDGKPVKELRSPEEVFNPDSLKSLKNIPITDNHPKELVTAENIQDLQKKNIIIGFTGSDVRSDGHCISVDYTITNKDAIAKIQNKDKKALSCGYNADLDFSQHGMAFGNNVYDAVQRNIKYNHVAVVNQGRAGDLAEIITDSVDHYSVQIINEFKEDKMEAKFILDGIEYVIDKDLVKHINQLGLNIQTLDEQIKKSDIEKADLQSKLSEVQGIKDAFEKEVKDLQEKVKAVKSDEEILKAVKERMELVKIADSLKIEVKDDLSNKDIKLSVIKSKNDKLDLSDKDDIYINACFDTIKSLIIVEKEVEDKNKKTVMDNQQPEQKTIQTRKQMYDSYVEKMKKESAEYKGSASI